MNLIPYTLPTVTRDENDRPVPMCPVDGSDLDRVLWAAALLAHDTGLRVDVLKSANPLNDWLHVRVGESMLPVPIGAASVLIHGALMGATEERHRSEDERRARLRATFKATR